MGEESHPHSYDLEIGEIILPSGHARQLTPEEVEKHLAGDDETVDFADWDETLHPRDDHGRFIAKDDLAEASHDDQKADELRARTNDPQERAKLEAAISDDGAPDSSGLEGSVLAAKPGGSDSRIPPSGTVIERTWKGDTYKVVVGDDGFFLKVDPHGVIPPTEKFDTLTQLAKAVTGAKSINGVVWWGLGKKGSKPSKPKPGKKPSKPPKAKGKSAGIWSKPAKKLPPPDEGAMKEAGFRTRAGGGWESKDIQLTGPRAREVLQVMMDHPSAMLQPDEADAVLEKLNVRFGTTIGKPGSKTKLMPHEKATMMGCRFSAVAAFAQMRALGMDKYVSTTVARPKSKNANGWFQMAKPDRVFVSSKHGKDHGISSLGKKHKDPKQNVWSWGRAVTATMIHETGHLLHNSAASSKFFGWCLKGFKGDKADGKFKWAKKEVGEEGLAALQAGWKAKEISKYGSSNALEFVAETFSRRCHGWPVSKPVMEVYRRLGGVELPGWEA
jgi:hypothetical protein